MSLCLFGGLASVAIDHAAANQFKIANVNLADLAGPAAAPPDTDRRSASPIDPAALRSPAVQYGAIEWALISSRLIPGVDSPTGKPIVVAEMAVTNTSQDAATRVRSSDVTLVWPDGLGQEVDRFEFIDERKVFSLEPEESILVTLVFKPNVMADPDLVELTLEVGEPGRIPALLPLVGPAAPTDFPIVDVIDSPPGALPAPAAAGDRPAIGLRRLVIDLNAGHYRAAVGQRILTIEASVGERPADGSHGSNPAHDRSYWQLSAGGRAIGPLRVEPLDDQGVALFFVLENGADDLVLSGDANGHDPVRVAVTLPEGPG